MYERIDSACYCVNCVNMCEGTSGVYVPSETQIAVALHLEGEGIVKVIWNFNT